MNGLKPIIKTVKDLVVEAFSDVLMAYRDLLTLHWIRLFKRTFNRKSR